MEYQLLIVNPGSTSTKIAIFKNYQSLYEKTLRHDVDVIGKFKSIFDQKDFRVAIIENFLQENNIKIEDIDVFVGRGGLVKPVQSGTYLVNHQMIDDLKHTKNGEHASNLGSIIAFEFANKYQKKAYIVDPVVVDELSDLARVSGLKGIERKSIFHALNQKAVAKRYAKEIGKNYHDLNLIIAHLGGGISVGYHQLGKVVDVNNALGNEGAYSPERSGTLPTYSIIDMCFSGSYKADEIKKLLVSKGGLVSYLGTSSGLEISNRIEKGDSEAKFYFEAMAYQIVKQIGALYFVAKGKIDAVIITGGLAYNSDIIDVIKEYLNPIITPVIYPGEDEMIALAEGVLRVLEGQEEVKIYE